MPYTFADQLKSNIDATDLRVDRLRELHSRAIRESKPEVTAYLVEAIGLAVECKAKLEAAAGVIERSGE
jgi:hypothetical protein